MKKNKFIPSILVIGMVILLLSQASQVRAGVTSALSDAFNKVIPGLFPMLVLSGFSCRTGLLCPDTFFFHGLCEHLFGVSCQSFPAILYGLTAGYPTGIKTAYTLYETEKIDTQQMRKLSSFCMAPGLSFSVMTVGNGLYENAKTGWLLFGSCTLACLCTGIICGRFGRKKTAYTPATQRNEPPAYAFTASVKTASDSILSVCAWMALCASLTACAERILPEKEMFFFRLLCEVTAACSVLCTAKPLPYTAFALGLGGICVWLQVLPDLRKSGCGISPFILSRVCCACLSGLFCRILCCAFPSAVPAVCVGETVKTTAKTPIFSIFLIFSCIIFIIDLAQCEKMCYTYYTGDENETETVGKEYRKMLCHLRNRQTDGRR